MNGADYIAQVRLTTKGGDVLAQPGDGCGRVPPASLGWLAEQGLIQRRESASTRATPTPVVERLIDTIGTGDADDAAADQE